MSRREQSLLKSFILFVLIVGIGIFVVIAYRQKTAPAAQASGDTPTATPVAAKTSSTSTNVHSAKAEHLLTLQTTRQKDGTIDYMFYVTDMNGGNGRLLFEKTLGADSSMTLPLNSWDPTDTYVFIEERNPGYVNYYVLKASGEPFANGDKFIDVGNVWNQKKMTYPIRSATGWASGTLLIIYTTKDDGTSGPHYWFEIPSTAILQLAS